MDDKEHNNIDAEIESGGLIYVLDHGGPRIEVFELELWSSYDTHFTGSNTIKAFLKGKGIIDDHGLQIMGKKETLSTEVEIYISSVGLDEIEEKLKKFDELMPVSDRTLIGKSYDEFHPNGWMYLTHDDEDGWSAQIYVAPVLADHLFSKASNGAIKSLILSPNLRNIYIDKLSSLAGMPELGQTWYVKDAENRFDRAVVGGIHGFQLLEHKSTLDLQGQHSRYHLESGKQTTDIKSSDSLLLVQMVKITKLLKWVLASLIVLILALLG